jgi:hypothetical protein
MRPGTKKSDTYDYAAHYFPFYGSAVTIIAGITVGKNMRMFRFDCGIIIA